MGIFSPDDDDFYVPRKPIPDTFGLGFIVVQFPEDKGSCAFIIYFCVDKSIWYTAQGDIFNEKYSFKLHYKLKDEMTSIIQSLMSKVKEENSIEPVIKLILSELKKRFENKEEFKGCDAYIYEPQVKAKIA